MKADDYKVEVVKNFSDTVKLVPQFSWWEMILWISIAFISITQSLIVMVAVSRSRQIDQENSNFERLLYPFVEGIKYCDGNLHRQ